MQSERVNYIGFAVIGISLLVLLLVHGCSTRNLTQTEEFGSVFVDSDIPDADIRLDNDPTGKKTPDTLFNVKVGSHLIEVEKEGYLSSPTSRIVKIQADTTVAAIFNLLDLTFGSLWVNSNVQGASIAIDNVPTNEQTPFLFDHNVSVGTHIVSVFKDGHSNDAPAKEVIDIATTDTVRLTFNLTPDSVGNKEGNITLDFELEDDFGDTLRLYAYRGFVCMINFWASTCYFCMVELPYLQYLHDEYSSDSLKIFALNYEDDFDFIRQKRSEFDLDFILLRDVGGAVKTGYKLPGTPVTIILDRSGKIYHYKLGFSDQPDKIQKIMDKFRANLNELFGK